MNEEQLREPLRGIAEGIEKAAPASLSAIEGALGRLNAPWFVRAWHQLRGHEGWGAGEEIHITIALLIAAGLLGSILLFG